MRNNKMKGFTLVELLVVIAILAILATVSVVGYTSYIEGATVRVDEDLAAQLTRFLEAYKVNNPGEITEDNIWEITQDVLDESGIKDLDPQAKQYGYHFYYDLAEGKYVAIDDETAMGTGSPFSAILKAFAGDVDKVYSAKPGNFFTVNHRYFFVDTEGSYADLLKSVYEFNGSASQLYEIYTEAGKITNSNGEATTAFADMLKQTAFITNEGTIVVSANDTHTMLVISNGFNTGVIGSQKTGNDGSVYMDASKPLITVDKDTVIRLPEGAKVFGDSLHIAGTGNVTIELGNNSWTNFDAGFTGTNVKLVMGGVECEMKDAFNVHKYVEGEGVGDFVATLGAMNPMVSFDVEIRDLGNVDDKLYTDATNGYGYFAFDKNNFTVHIINAVGQNPELPVSNTAVTWSINNTTLFGIDENTGKITILDGASLLNSDVTEYTVTANPIAEEADPVSFKIRMVKIADAEISLDTTPSNYWTKGGSVNLVYSNIGKEFTVTVYDTTYNYPEVGTNIKLDETVSLSYACAHDAVVGCSHYDENSSAHTAGEDNCETCIYLSTYSGHTHSGNCCTHGTDYTDPREKLVKTETIDVPYNPNNGVISYYACSMCPNYGKTIDGAEHWCYGVCTDDMTTTINGTYAKYQIGDVCYVNSACDKSCHYGKTTNTPKVAHVHSGNCCGHVCLSDNSTCAFACTHTHTADGSCYNHDTVKSNVVGDKITIVDKSGDCAGTLTVTVDNLAWGNVTINYVDFSKTATIPNKNITNISHFYIGDDNAINVSDLFQIRDGMTLPAGAVLHMWKLDGSDYMSSTGLTYFDKESDPVWVETGSGDAWAKADTIALDSLNKEIWFKGTSDSIYINMAIFTSGGERLSETVVVEVVDATNVRTYADIENNSTEGKDKDGNITSRTIKSSIVLLADINSVTKGTFFSIPANKTLYGNCFTIDATNARIVSEFINLKGTMKDVKIIGAVYKDLALSMGEDYGAALVRALKDSFIDNCYLSNCRSPLRLDGSMTVRNSVFFGGRYANIDIAGTSTLTLEGTVTTVQQPIKHTWTESGLFGSTTKETYVIGVGISAWFDDTQKSVAVANYIDDEGNEIAPNLVQYNFIDNSVAEYMPVISISKLGISYPVLDLKDPFKDLMSNSIYNDKRFNNDEANGSSTYVHSGIISTDKYMLTYGVSESNGKVTITVNKPAHSQTGVDLVILYDANIYTENIDDSANYPENEVPANPNSDGRLILKNQDLTNGASYTFNVKSGQSFNAYHFSVGSDLHRTMKLDTALAGKYHNLDYATKDLSGTLNLVEDIYSMHGKGIHYGKITVDVYTQKSAEIVDEETGAITEDQRLLEYINMGDYYAELDFSANGSLAGYKLP